MQESTIQTETTFRLRFATCATCLLSVLFMANTAHANTPSNPFLNSRSAHLSLLDPTVRSFLNISGGSIPMTDSSTGGDDNENAGSEHSSSIHDALQGNDESESQSGQKEEGDDNLSNDSNVEDSNMEVESTIDAPTEEAETTYTPPLRISTSQNGDEVVTTEISAAAAQKAVSRQAKKMARRQKRKLRNEEKGHMRYAKKLKNRNNPNIKRKVLHAGFGLAFATLNQVLGREKFLPIISLITTGTLAMELLRYRKGFGWMNDVLHFVLGGALRKQEMEGKFTGSFYYFLGVTLTSYLFPTSCASLGICQLALADPSASYFGRQTRHVYWSRIENGLFGFGRNKGVLGFLGGALFCFPFNYYVLSIAQYGAGDGVIGTAVGSVAKVLAESVVGDIDDADGIILGGSDEEGLGSSSSPVATVAKVVASRVLPGGRRSIAIASIALGFAGAFADLCVPTPALTMPKKICGVPMPAFHVDDNVVVPIVSGYACTKIFDYLGWNAGVELAKFVLF